MIGMRFLLMGRGVLEAGSTHQLYMRDMVSGESLQVDAPGADCRERKMRGGWR